MQETPKNQRGLENNVKLDIRGKPKVKENRNIQEKHGDQNHGWEQRGSKTKMYKWVIVLV